MNRKSSALARPARKASNTVLALQEARLRVKAAKQQVKSIKAQLKIARAAVKAAKSVRAQAELTQQKQADMRASRALSTPGKDAAGVKQVKPRAARAPKQVVAAPRKKVVKARLSRPAGKKRKAVDTPVTDAAKQVQERAQEVATSGLSTDAA